MRAWRAGFFICVAVAACLAPLAQGSAVPEPTSGDVVVRVTVGPQDCNASISEARDLVDAPDLPLVRVMPGKTVACGSDGFTLQSLRVAPRPNLLASALARLVPFGVASASPLVTEELPDTITIEVRIHWDANGGAWVQACVSTDEDAPVCARQAAGVTQPPDAGAIAAVARAVAERAPDGRPALADAQRALDAALAALHAPDAGAAPTPPVPSATAPEDASGVTSVSAPLRETAAGELSAWTDDHLVSSHWNGSGALGSWSAEVATPSADDVLLTLSLSTPLGSGATPLPILPTAQPTAGGGAPERSAAAGGAAGETPVAVGEPAAPARVASVGPTPLPARATPPAAPAPPLAAIALAGALALVLAAGAILLRLRERTLCEQPTRQRILDALRSRPGRTARGLAADLGLHPNTVRYHLWVMTRASFVTVRKAKGRDHHFLAGTGAPAALASAAMLHEGPARALYEAIASNPGAQVRDICAVTRTHRTTVHYHVRTLREAGLLTVQRDGKRIRLFARPATI